MVIQDEFQLTQAVLAEAERTPDPRLKQILTALIRHLHGFAREVRLTEREFDQAINLVTALGHHTTESHNETRLIAGSLGLSTLVCLMNNGQNGRRETSANLLGPFWRAGSPRMQNGACIVRSPTPGKPLLFTGRIVDPSGHPVAGAEIDVWHASPDGLYENQDPSQAEWNLRGKFTSDAQGVFSYRSVKPSGYPVPMQGPTGALLRAQGRHPFRPAHLHSLIYKPGFKTMTSQIYSHDDPLIDTDAQFGVTRSLIGHYVLHESEPAPDPDVTGPWYSLEHVFELEPGDAWLPTPPVSAKKRAEPQAVS
ncbi:MAG: dioxygenase [Steroidobacteraceae bacterium]